jgi:MoaA/NifB/PqqE/SkfB family radical SAM enzyme
MSSEDIKALIDYFKLKGVNWIGILGGEPFIRDDIYDIMSHITSRALFMTVSTNGTLEGAYDFAALAELKPQLQVSIDGSTPQINDRLRGVGAFRRTLAFIDGLNTHDIPFSIGYTVSRANQDQIRDMAVLASELRARSLRLEIFIPIAEGKAMTRDLSVTAAELAKLEGAIAELMNEFPFIVSPFVNTSQCGAGIHTIVVNIDRTLSACDLLAEKERTLPFGDITEIADLWLNDPVFARYRGLNGHRCRLFEILI